MPCAVSCLHHHQNACRRFRPSHESSLNATNWLHKPESVALYDSTPGRWSAKQFLELEILCYHHEMSGLRPFHIAFPVDDLAAARHFYGIVLGLPEGRSADHWIDFNLFGHQIVAHHRPKRSGEMAHSNPVDGHDVPIPHFGVVLNQSDWEILAERLRAAQIEFVIEPYTRFKGEVGEQSTMFFLDPAGNALEFKAFADLDQLFAK